MPNSTRKATSDTQAYVDLTAQALCGEAAIVSERYLPGGVTERVFALGRARPIENPEGEMRTIGIDPHRFGEAPLREYAEWPIKWWREAVQNSVDAGAKNIELEAHQQHDGTWSISCSDDGSGMSERVLLDKFLMLGASEKATPGATGGFGKAKELLLLPWLKWEVRTRDLHALGSGLEYRFERGVGPYLNGTLLAVVMPEDKNTSAVAALEFLQRCTLTGINVKVNGDRFTNWLRRGKKLREMNRAEIYHNKSQHYGALFVRHNGLFMYKRWLPSGVVGTVLAELIGSSTELLAANRDTLNDDALQRQIDNYTNEIAADVTSALKAKSRAFKRIYEGEKYRSQRQAARLVEALGPVPAMRSGEEAIEIKGEAKKRLLEQVAQAHEEAQREESAERRPAGPISAETAQAMVEGYQIIGSQQAEALAKQLAWEPAFYVWNEIDDYTPQPKFLPENMTPQVRALAQLWAELCRWVLIQLGSDREYGVGFVFSEETGAQYVREEGEDWLMLNPFKDMGERKDIWSKTDSKDLSYLYALAVHECTHLVDRASYHDESFAHAVTLNFARCSDGMRKVRGIAASIRARAPRGAGPARKERTWDRPELRDLLQVTIPATADGYGYRNLTVGVGGKANEFKLRDLTSQAVLDLLSVSETADQTNARDFYHKYGSMPRRVYISREALLRLAEEDVAFDGAHVGAVERGLAQISSR